MAPAASCSIENFSFIVYSARALFVNKTLTTVSNSLTKIRRYLFEYSGSVETNITKLAATKYGMLDEKLYKYEFKNFTATFRICTKMK